MDLLPSSHSEFSSPDYWERFFKKRGKIPFEWYGEYPQLHGIIHKYISPANTVLVVGCGNSALSENMYDNGLQNLVNIDISDVVIRQMADRHRVKRFNMTFEKVDVTEMTYPDCHFNAALDKGTLDALMVSEEAPVVQNVQAMFGQIARCLKVGGRYIIISLLQDHVQRILLQFFTDMGWPIRIHRIHTDQTDEGNKSMSMPVFAVVITKFKPMPNMPQIIEVCRFEDRIDRLEGVQYLSAIIKDMQYYHIVRQQLQKHLPGDEQVSLELHSAASEVPRYSLTVVDSPKVLQNKFAIFIVPQGRETEWLFSTDKGRLHLLDSAAFQRLVVVTLNRGHTFENMEAIKAELSSKVMELAPPDCPSKSQVPYLSIGEDIGRRFPVSEGHSEASGGYIVEDVEINGGQLFRRLVFLKNKNVVQTEARLKEVRKKKKRRGQQAREDPPDKVRVDKGYIPCDYLIAMVAGLGFLPSIDKEVSCVLVGLGGGQFPSFIQGAFPKVAIEAVELDPSVVDVATHWFDLQPNDQLKIHVADGLDFVRNLVASGDQRDVLALDVDCKDTSVALSCPPSVFVEHEFLTTVSKLLAEDGLFILNLASRDDGIKQEVLDRIHTVFASCAKVDLEEDINTIVFASNISPAVNSFSDKDRLNAVLKQMSLNIKSVYHDTNVDLVEIMTNLKLSDNEAWVATVSQPEKTTCGGTVPELLGTALTQRPEGDPTSRGRIEYIKGKEKNSENYFVPSCATQMMDQF
ncbi:methyltransferase-like protein 13 [Plakobranchus ocellatus]|uniref:Methyltransferase-like protein 13 n=1 Tax=Plakobranchus ocellatus TaxID=259542 RepID=A0AAV4D6Y9_9GAST|nr:methyltransferase-like protein 13 [Plakobranchus ocellatus]